MSVRQGRYIIKRVLKGSADTDVTVVVAYDTRANEQLVVLKRWECTDLPIARRAKELIHYEKATEALARVQHPLIPRVLDRFAEGRHYYIVLTYIDGESLEERLKKLLRPISEHEGIGYMNTLLNILISLEQQQPPLRHYDISPANILIERTRKRAFLTGFQIPPLAEQELATQNHRTTRKIVVSPYLPLQDSRYDQRTCIYMLAASLHHALTNYAPPHYPSFPAARMLNPAISPEFNAILSHALIEDPRARYQSYAELKRDLQRLL